MRLQCSWPMRIADARSRDVEADRLRSSHLNGCASAHRSHWPNGGECLLSAHISVCCALHQGSSWAPWRHLAYSLGCPVHPRFRTLGHLEMTLVPCVWQTRVPRAGRADHFPFRFPRQRQAGRSLLLMFLVLMKIAECHLASIAAEALVRAVGKPFETVWSGAFLETLSVGQFLRHLKPSSGD